MLHHYLLTQLPEGSTLVVYCDNCSRQNKNHTVIVYFSYLVKILKRFPEVEVNFMIAGHTIFTPDGNFGTTKARIKARDCCTIQDLVGSDGKIRSSAYNNYDLPYKDPWHLLSIINVTIGRILLLRKFVLVQEFVIGIESEFLRKVTISWHQQGLRGHWHHPRSWFTNFHQN